MEESRAARSKYPWATAISICSGRSSERWQSSMRILEHSVLLFLITPRRARKFSAEWSGNGARRLTHSGWPRLAASAMAWESAARGSETGMSSLTHSAWPEQAAQRRAWDFRALGKETGMRSLTHSAWPSAAAQQRASDLAKGAGQWNEPSRALNMASARGRGERMEFRGVGIRKREKKFDAFGTWGDRASSNKGAEE